MKRKNIFEKMKTIICFLIILPAMFLLSCEQVKDWSDPTDSDAPGPVTNPKVENLNGGAQITYVSPADDDLLGVKAVYSLDDGKVRESFASASRDTITLEGYGTTGQYTVTLYALDKSGNESEPVSVTIEPMKPPVDLLRQSLNVQQAFSGVFLSWENIFGKEMAITLYAADSTGFLEYFDTYYTNAISGSTSFRGFDNTEREFRIEIRDRWNNYAIPFDTVITPLKEVNIFGRENGMVIWEMYGMSNEMYKYMGNIPCPSSNWERFTDGVGYGAYYQLVNWSTHYFTGVDQVLFMPYYITIDMKKPASYSRFKWWQGSRSPIGSATIPIVFSLWGTNDPKPVDLAAGQIANLQYWTEWGTVAGTVVVNGTGEWMNDWEKLGEYRLAYPSGMTKYVAGQVTAEDQIFIQEGFEFDIDPAMTSKPFRYLRFRVEETNSNEQWMLSELQFFGNFIEE
ncbi:MAG: DUF4959 domain-containing protein [Tannerella sp.]|jgi:hypothetical protein|nr:DUF4959 domain-containing protein [Tannerella sp.]